MSGGISDFIEWMKGIFGVWCLEYLAVQVMNFPFLLELFT